MAEQMNYRDDPNDPPEGWIPEMWAECMALARKHDGLAGRGSLAHQAELEELERRWRSREIADATRQMREGHKRIADALAKIPPPKGG